MNMQVNIEKARNASINIKNKKIREEFKELITCFFYDNFYYIAQKYFIFILIKDLFEDLSEKIGKIIYKKVEMFLSGDEANDSYYNIYLRIFNKFEEKINTFRDKNGKIYN